jgi:hypothetical protein
MKQERNITKISTKQYWIGLGTVNYGTECTGTIKVRMNGINGTECCTYVFISTEIIKYSTFNYGTFKVKRTIVQVI